MKTTIAIVMWVVMIGGGLPASAQRELEFRLVWWHPRLMGTISSFLEGFCGWHFLREVLFRHQLGVLSTDFALILGSIGLYMLLEGLVRLGVILKLPEAALPSWPLTVIYRGIAAVVGNRG